MPQVHTIFGPAMNYPRRTPSTYTVAPSSLPPSYFTNFVPPRFHQHHGFRSWQASDMQLPPVDYDVSINLFVTSFNATYLSQNLLKIDETADYCKITNLFLNFEFIQHQNLLHKFNNNQFNINIPFKHIEKFKFCRYKKVTFWKKAMLIIYCLYCLKC